MILLADAGATKIDWRLLHHNRAVFSLQTPGFNPAISFDCDFSLMLRERLLPELSLHCALTEIDQVWYYGAGVAGAQIVKMLCDCLQDLFPQARVGAFSDLLGAARALCGDAPGIVCILGTGSNSCYYDGKAIVHNVPAGGYILGDEGSGAYLGRHLVSDYLKHCLPVPLWERFEATFEGITVQKLIENVYRKPAANQYLARFCPFLSEHRTHPYVQNLLASAFDAFFRRNVAHYPYTEHPVHCTGSIAFLFREELAAAATRLGGRLGKIVKAPAQDLAAYHLRQTLLKQD